MRNEFHDTLDGLVVDLADMCGRASAMMDSATAALLSVDMSHADELRSDLADLRAIGTAVHDRAYHLLARQAPVARDLRTVVAALHIGADADRMGGLASHVARMATRRHPVPAVPEEAVDLFTEMGSTTVQLAADAGAAVRSSDAAQAERVCAGDQSINDLHQQLFTRIAGPHWRHGPMVAADVALLGRFYERFADHAVEIARRVYFQATGSYLVAEPARFV